MARVNFREIRKRFTHIDATFVSCELGFGSVVPRYVVRFYPWWEHPAYMEAVRAGKPWGFRQAVENGAKDVVLYPIGLAECRVAACETVTDWSFCEEHPLLWRYEDQAQVFCNGPCDVVELVRRVRNRFPSVPKELLYEHLDPLLQYPPPFCLGDFPLSLFRIVADELSKMDVPIYVQRQPSPRQTPIALLIDGSDYIIADDFELEVPNFQHDPDWFRPA